MKKQGLPSRNECVICKVKKIYPNSVSVEMIEYGKDGMIHVSEVARRWVKNIREFLKEGQFIVCRVMSVESHSIQLSFKRVDIIESKRKMNEFKRERKAEKLLEMTGKKLKKSLEGSYKELGHKLQEEFGSMNKAFEMAAKNPDLLVSKIKAKKWTDAMIEVAKKIFIEKEYCIRADLKLISFKPDGINVIKNVFSKVKKGDVKYISAGKYRLSVKGKNYKELKSEAEEIAESIVGDLNKQDGEASFKIIES